jgi:hypothetical protein
MKLLGFNYTKIKAEKNKDNFKDLEINQKIDLIEIEKVNSSSFMAKEEILAVSFSFKIDYKPEIGLIDLSGNILIGLEPKVSKEVLKQWKEKKTPEDFRLPLLNLILRKCSVKSLEIEEELGLPLSVKLPRITATQKTEEKK